MFVLSGTQRNLYSTDLCWGFVLGVMQILAFALGVMQILVFLDTNKLGSKPMRGPNASVFALQWNIGSALQMSLLSDLY